VRVGDDRDIRLSCKFERERPGGGNRASIDDDDAATSILGSKVSPAECANLNSAPLDKGMKGQAWVGLTAKPQQPDPCAQPYVCKNVDAGNASYACSSSPTPNTVARHCEPFSALSIILLAIFWVACHVRLYRCAIAESKRRRRELRVCQLDRPCSFQDIPDAKDVCYDRPTNKQVLGVLEGAALDALPTRG